MNPKRVLWNVEAPHEPDAFPGRARLQPSRSQPVQYIAARLRGSVALPHGSWSQCVLERETSLSMNLPSRSAAFSLIHAVAQLRNTRNTRMSSHLLVSDQAVSDSPFGHGSLDLRRGVQMREFPCFQCNQWFVYLRCYGFGPPQHAIVRTRGSGLKQALQYGSRPQSMFTQTRELPIAR